MTGAPPPPRPVSPHEEVRTERATFSVPPAPLYQPQQINVGTAAPGSFTDPRVWLEAVFRYGFVLVFASLSAAFGVYFGLQILETQRQGISAIQRIEQTEAQQVVQLNEMNTRQERLERGLELLVQHTVQREAP